MDRQTDGRTARVTPIYPQKLCLRGLIIKVCIKARCTNLFGIFREEESQYHDISKGEEEVNMGIVLVLLHEKVGSGKEESVIQLKNLTKNVRSVSISS